MAKLIIDNLGLGILSNTYTPGIASGGSPSVGNQFSIGNKYTKSGSLKFSSTCNPFLLRGGLVLASSFGNTISSGSSIPANKITSFAKGLSGPLYIQKTPGSSSANYPYINSIQTTYGTENIVAYSNSFPKSVPAAQHTTHGSKTFLDIFEATWQGVGQTFVLYSDSLDWGLYMIERNGTTSYTTNTDLIQVNTGQLFGYSDSILNNGAYNNYADVFCFKSENGFTYIANGNVLHLFDGDYNSGGLLGQIKTDVLRFSKNIKITDIIELNGKMWIATEQTPSNLKMSSTNTNNVVVYVWDRVSTTVGFSNSYSISNASRANSLSIINGEIHIICEKVNLATSIYRFDNIKFIEVTTIAFEIPTGLWINQLGEFTAPYNRRSVVNLENGIVWISRSDTLNKSNGVLWYYGKINIEDTKNSLFKIGYNENITDYALMADGGTILCSGNIEGAPSSFTMWAVNLSNVNSRIRTSSIKLNTIVLPKLCTVDGITVMFKGGITLSGNINIDIYNDKGDKYTKTSTVQSVIDKTFQYYQVGMQKVNNLYIDISIDTGTGLLKNIPAIDRIEIDYTPTVRVQ